MEYLFRVVLIGCLFLSGCATFQGPPRTAETVIKQGNVGVIVNLPDVIHQSHIGTTIFNNFDKTHQVDWQLEKYAINRLSEKLSAAGLTPVILTDDDLALGAGLSLTYLEEKQWYINKQYQDPLANLKDKHNLSAIVSLNDRGRHNAVTECTQYGCKYFYANGPGVFSRGALILHRNFFIPGLISDVVVFDPLYNLGFYEPLDTYRARANFAIPDVGEFKKPAKLKEPTQEELLPLKDRFQRHIDELVNSIVVTLTSIPVKR